MKIQQLILLLFFIPVSLTLRAQPKCFYYALTKKVQNNVLSTNVSGGQFITFTYDICYESNHNGFSIGHGTLELNKNYSNSDFKIYMGSSYWGDDAVFKFKSDLSILNVILENGDVYVYKRQNAPAGVTTCSLIREQGNGSTGGGDYAAPAYPPNGGYNGGGYNNGNNNGSTQAGSSQRQNSTASSTNRQPTKHTCPRCNGKKRIVMDTHPAMFGTENYKVRCDECGGYFLRSTGHTHVTCPQCHGKGYFTTD